MSEPDEAARMKPGKGHVQLEKNAATDPVERQIANAAAMSTEQSSDLKACRHCRLVGAVGFALGGEFEVDLHSPV